MPPASFILAVPSGPDRLPQGPGQAEAALFHILVRLGARIAAT
jgi:hypothetical protein